MILSGIAICNTAGEIMKRIKKDFYRKIKDIIKELYDTWEKTETNEEKKEYYFERLAEKQLITIPGVFGDTDICPRCGNDLFGGKCRYGCHKQIDDMPGWRD